MAICYELTPCAPTLPTIYVAGSVQGFSPYLQQFVNIGGNCYQVKQSSTASNCSTTVPPPQTAFASCLECQGEPQSICGQCPDYYFPQEIDGQTVCVQEESEDASFTGTLGPVDVGDISALFNQQGLNILEDITNKTWPIVGGQNNLTGQWWTPLTNPNSAPTNYSNGGIGNGFFGQYCFRENWFNGPLVYGDTGYSYWSNTPVATTAQDAVDKKNWSTNIFASHNLSSQGRLNYGIKTSNEQCPGIVNYYPNPADGLNGFVTPGPSCDVSTRLDICFDVPQTKQYLLGFSSDNEIRILIKEPGDTVEKPLFLLKGQSSTVSVSVNRATSATDNTAIAGNSNASQNVGWGQYHIAPITLTAGPNTITIIGINYGGALSFVCDIINLSLSEFKTEFLDPVTGPTKTLQDLADVCIFSTQQYRPGTGNPFNPDDLPIPEVPVTSGFYYCSDGSILECVPGGIPQCTIQTILPLTNCCYKLTKCGEGTIIYTNTDLSQYQGQVITISISSDPQGCYLVEQITESCPDGAVEVTVLDSYANCETCLPSYKLYNCKDQDVTLQTANSAFQGYLGKIVNLVEYPGDCWEVGPNDQKTIPLQNLTVSGQPFDTCEECDPKEFGLRNCVNGATVISTVDLSAYVGKVVKADNFPGLCFTVEENPCNCLKITINGQVYNVNREENFFNGKPYFQFLTVNNLPIVIAYDSNQLRWEVYNPDTQVVYFYSNFNIDCPATSVWTKLDPTFPGNITTQVCTLRILNISPTEEFSDCECCVNC